jgi:hypothetical protein
MQYDNYFILIASRAYLQQDCVGPVYVLELIYVVVSSVHFDLFRHKL